MLKPYQVEEVRQLHAQGLSRRAIARKTGRARVTVDRILNDLRPDYEVTRPNRRQTDDIFDGPPVRCPGCGGNVFMPCVVCRDRDARETRRHTTRLQRALRKARASRKPETDTRFRADRTRQTLPGAVE